MAERTFGWVQEAYVLGNLKRVVQLFLYDSPVNKMLREDKIPRPPWSLGLQISGQLTMWYFCLSPSPA